MAFSSVSEFFAMGGHGLYVWLSYGVASAVFIFNVLSPMIMKQKLVQDAKRRQRREQV